MPTTVTIADDLAKKLRPFLRQLRPLAQDAQPTVRDLVALIKKSGANNDLIDLTKGNVPVRDVAIGPVHFAALMHPTIHRFANSAITRSVIICTSAS